METAPASRGRILLADDNPSLRRVLANRLRKEGFDVVEAGDPTEVFAYLGALRDMDSDLDLIVSDIQMPLGSGLTMMQNLRQFRWSVPKLLITSYASEEVREIARMLEIPVMEKPFPMQPFTAACAAAVAMHRAQRALPFVHADYFALRSGDGPTKGKSGRTWESSWPGLGNASC